MTKLLRQLLSCAAIVSLASCGGGGNGGSPPAVATQSPSYWTMDAHSYLNGGVSAYSTSTVGSVPITVAVVSTATTAGGDTSNGAYSGSALSFSFAGTSAGIYQVVPDRTALVAADPATLPIVVECNVGIGMTTGASLYTASTGQVKVSIDSAGKYHFDSVGALPTAKTLDVLGGVAAAPSTMALTVHDAD